MVWVYVPVTGFGEGVGLRFSVLLPGDQLITFMSGCRLWFGCRLRFAFVVGFGFGFRFGFRLGFGLGIRV